VTISDVIEPEKPIQDFFLLEEPPEEYLRLTCMYLNGIILKFGRLYFRSHLLQIRDSAYLHGNQYVQGVVAIATETWNFISVE